MERKGDEAEMNILTSEIRAELARKGITQGALAKQIGISEYSLSKKINGKAQFKLEEAQKIVSILGVEPSIFFS